MHDAVLVVVHHEVIERFEQNPLGRWLIQCGGGEVWLSVFVKFAGTAAVCAVLVRLYHYRSALADSRRRFGRLSTAATLLPPFQVNGHECTRYRT